MSDRPVELPPSENWTPDQLLAACRRLPWRDVLVIGVTDADEDGETLVVRASRGVRRKDALWLIEQARRFALD